MAFEPVYDEIKTEERNWLCRSQAVVEAKMIPSPDVSIAKVLSVECKSSISAAEVFAGEARYNGKVEFSALFLDGNGVPRVMEYQAEFTDKITDEKINGKIKPYFTSSILDVDIASAGSNEIKPACVVEITLVADCANQVKCLTSCGEGVYTKDEKMSYFKLVCSDRKNITVTDSVENVKFDRVLKSSSVAVVKRVSVLNDSIMLEGDLVTHLIGVRSDGTLSEQNVVTPISEELPASDARSGDEATVLLGVVKASTRVVTEENSTTAEIDVTLETGYAVYTQSSVNMITDMFSMEREMTCRTEDKEVCRRMNDARFCETIGGNVTLDVSSPAVDGILCSDAFRASVTGVSAGEGRITVEGIVSGNIIYYSAEESSTCSVSVEIPFSVTENCDVTDEYSVNASACVTDVKVRVRRDSEIEVKAEVCFSAYTYRKCHVACIVECGEGEEKHYEGSAITVHLASKGEGLWDIAKTTGAAPEQIMAQNPDIELPLSGGERILIYRNLLNEN